MYIDTITAEMNFEIDLIDERKNNYFSGRNQITEYIPNWEMTSEREGGNDADTVKAEKTDSTNA